MSLSITLILIIIICLVSIPAFSNPGLLNRLLFHPYTIKREGQWYRFLSSGFVHGDWVHLIFNMIALFYFGRVMEYVLMMKFGVLGGGLAYLALFVVGIIISHISTYRKYQNAPHYRSLGASGGVSAVVFASIMFFPINDICIYGIICIPGFILGPLYLLYTYYQGKRDADNINHEAHLSGAIFGIAFSVLVDPGVLAHFVEQISTWRIG
jgi:membrane associated rhomboid family serine protease